MIPDRVSYFCSTSTNKNRKFRWPCRKCKFLNLTDATLSVSCRNLCISSSHEYSEGTSFAFCILSSQAIRFGLEQFVVLHFFLATLRVNTVNGWPLRVPRWVTFGLRHRWRRSVSWWSCLFRAPSGQRWTYSCPFQSHPDSPCIIITVIIAVYNFIYAGRVHSGK